MRGKDKREGVFTYSRFVDIYIYIYGCSLVANFVQPCTQLEKVSALARGERQGKIFCLPLDYFFNLEKIIFKCWFGSSNFFVL